MDSCTQITVNGFIRRAITQFQRVALKSNKHQLLQMDPRDAL